MRRYTLIIIMALMATASHLAAQEMRIEYFYDKLSPYGHWAGMDELGWVWQPTNIGTNWRPYSDGSWVYTNEGWSFNSSAAWSWAAYHYGRWSFQGTYGWVWVPGTEWAPAWVAWRKNEQFIGWAALPPEIQWTPENGLGTQIANWDAEIDPTGWSFIETQYFSDADLSSRIQKPSRNVSLYQETSNITNYTYENKHIVDNAVPVDEVEKFTQKKITVYRIFETSSFTAPSSSTNHPNQIGYYRPNFIRTKIKKAPVNIVILPNSAQRDEQLRRNERIKRRTERRMERKENNDQQQTHKRQGINRENKQEKRKEHHRQNEEGKRTDKKGNMGKEDFR